MCDPPKGTGERLAPHRHVVIGVDQGGNKYLLDGVRHRMKLTARWGLLKSLKRKWEAHSGVQMVKIGYERYGMQVDLEVIEDTMVRENNHFKIEEINTPRQGRHSKDDRIEWLEPTSAKAGSICPALPITPITVPIATGRSATRRRPTSRQERREKGLSHRPDRRSEGAGADEVQAQVREHRVVTALRRRDEDGRIYDMTRAFIGSCCCILSAPTRT